MNRIVPRIDAKSEEFEAVLRRLKEWLSSVGIKYGIVEVCELMLGDIE
jgi:hypothetical protein